MFWLMYGSLIYGDLGFGKMVETNEFEWVLPSDYLVLITFSELFTRVPGELQN